MIMEEKLPFILLMSLVLLVLTIVIPHYKNRDILVMELDLIEDQASHLLVVDLVKINQFLE